MIELYTDLINLCNPIVVGSGCSTCANSGGGYFYQSTSATSLSNGSNQHQSQSSDGHHHITNPPISDLFDLDEGETYESLLWGFFDSKENKRVENKSFTFVFDKSFRQKAVNFEYYKISNGRTKTFTKSN
jgi:hypothetical protein